MEARCWSDYLCPWCYVGQDRDRLLTELGVTVVHLPYELHPEIPPEGRTVRPDGRLAPTLDRVAEACAEVGLAFRRPTRMPNTRAALATAEWLRRHDPAAFAEVHRELFAAHFVRGEPIDDPAVIGAIVAGAGGDAAEVRRAVDDGRAGRYVDESMAAARGHGIASTPTWLVGELQIPGAVDPATVTRWVQRLTRPVPPSA